MVPLVLRARAAAWGGRASGEVLASAVSAACQSIHRQSPPERRRAAGAYVLVALHSSDALRQDGAVCTSRQAVRTVIDPASRHGIAPSSAADRSPTMGSRGYWMHISTGHTHGWGATTALWARRRHRRSDLGAPETRARLRTNPGSQTRATLGASARTPGLMTAGHPSFASRTSFRAPADGHAVTWQGRRTAPRLTTHGPSTHDPRPRRVSRGAAARSAARSP